MLQRRGKIKSSSSWTADFGFCGVGSPFAGARNLLRSKTSEEGKNAKGGAVPHQVTYLYYLLAVLYCSIAACMTYTSSVINSV